MTRAAIYARFSSDSQRDESIDIQLEQCGRYVESRGWEIAGAFCDYALTGTTDDRPQFQAMMHAAQDGEFDAVVVLKNDRFARNVEVSRKYKRKLREAGVRFVSVREGESDGTPASFLHEAMDEAFAEYYSRNLAVLIRDGIQKNAERCLASGRRVYGYDVDDTDHFVVNPVEAEVVRGIFDRLLAGQGTADIAARLNADGIRTRMGNEWITQAVTKIIENPAYKGVYRYAKKEIEGGMPVIVEPWRWQAAQEELAIRKHRRPGSQKSEYLLTGKLFCAEDGTPLCGTSGKGKLGTKYRYYLCRGKGGCGMRLPADHVEETAVAAVRSFLADDASVEAMVAEVMAERAVRADAGAAWRKELASLEKRNETLVERTLATGTPWELVAPEHAANEGRAAELRMMIERDDFERSQMADEETVRAYLRRFGDAADYDENRARLIIESFIDKIFIDREDMYIVFGIENRKTEFAFEDLCSLKNNEHLLNASSEGVRIEKSWWR